MTCAWPEGKGCITWMHAKNCWGVWSLAGLHVIGLPSTDAGCISGVATLLVESLLCQRTETYVESLF
jgi:hypothetical protein